MSSLSRPGDLYISPQGSDGWSGRLPEPDATGEDGPLASIGKARDVIRQRKTKGELPGPITVWIRGGTYSISEPLVFGPHDSAPVTYAAFPGEHPIVDGGMRLTGWRQELLNGRQVWVTDVPEVAAGKWTFRQLFVNGERRQRPRLPKSGHYWMANVPGARVDQPGPGSSSFQCAPGDIRSWHNLTDVEVVALHYWTEERMPIVSFDEETGTVVSSRKSIMALNDIQRHRFARYYVDNVFEALSEPGEWYLDRTLGRVYYLPLAGEQIEEIDAVAPRTEYLLRLEGSPDEGRYVEFLRFEGLCFRHSSWVQPKGIANRWPSEADMDPSIEYAADAQGALSVPGAIRLCGARSCAIEDCVIEHIGWYGIELSDGCLGNRIIGNEIHDLGAGGIKIDGADAHGSVARRTGNNKVTDNHIHDGSRVFHAGYGILMTHSFGNDISHNHVHDFGVTGISSGWLWDYSESVSHDNHIEKNHIHDIGKGLLSDLAGIYTLSVQPGTVIRGNVIHDIAKWNYGGWAIYPDQASSHILIENNVCYRVDSEPFYQHFGRENIVRNNIFAFGAEGQAGIGKPEAHPAFTFERNILITDGTALFVGIPENLKRANFYSDLNLFWDVSGRDLLCADANVDTDGRFYRVETFSLETWREMGHDLHSIVADPRCKDLDNLDFTLAPDSPAFSLGFRPIDTSDVGPRPKGHRE